MKILKENLLKDSEKIFKYKFDDNIIGFSLENKSYCTKMFFFGFKVTLST